MVGGNEVDIGLGKVEMIWQGGDGGTRILVTDRE